MREARKLSLKDVAEKIQMKSMDVDHFENGRRFYTPEEITMFLKLYKFKPEDFQALMNLKILNKQIVNHLIVTKVIAGE